MTEAATRRRYTAEDLLAMQDGDSYELDDGELREVPVGFESQLVAGRLFARLLAFAEASALGTALPMEVGLQIFPDRPQRIPRPDGGFISWERLPHRSISKGFLTVAPELVIESISPREPAAYVERKVREYLSANVRLVWVLYPDTRTATVYRPDGSAVAIHPDGALDGEDVLPGFTCPLADIMPPATAEGEGE